ncbi:MAG: ZIP family metal transporter [Halobacteriales archaeon]|nr:ZIP family metal transporter [Halobacteriales archaeon]
MLAVLSVAGLQAGVASKVVVIGWVAFFAMAVALPLGGRASQHQHARRLVWGYGLASGAMITSAAIFLLPSAINHHPQFGGLGVAIGLLVGFGSHTIGHRLTHLDFPVDHAAVALSAHAFSAGIVIGVVYAGMPDLGLLLGLAIVSHKGPAGYAAARRLATDNKPVSILLVPAAGVGITAILAGLLTLPAAPVFNAVVFGFAAGIFLHVALDFLPRCELGGDVYAVVSISEQAHDLLDSLRIHAVASTAFGAAAVFVLWFAIY